jgi:hypothetical protein
MKAGSAKEYWLLDGAGMMANRQEYVNFVKTAIERQTVRHFFGVIPYCYLRRYRRPHAKINFGPLNYRC